MSRMRARAAWARPGGHQGFSLIEVVTVMTIIGVLAALVLPHLRAAAYKADAAAIVSDGQTVRMAALTYFAEQAEFPPTAAPGEGPSDLVDLLPDGFDFEYEGDVVYQWRRTSTGVRFGTGHMGQFHVLHNGRWGLADAMKSHQGDLTTWTPAETVFLFPQ